MSSEKPHREEWNESEQRSLRSLSRELLPSPDVEERTVEILSRKGLIRHPGSTGVRPWRRLLRRSRLAWSLASLATLAAVFLAGLSVGQRRGMEIAASSLGGAQQQDLARMAAHIQRTGTAYVAALAALATSSTDGAQGVEALQAREVALAALYAASQELVRLDPNDPVAARILQGLEEDHRNQEQPDRERKVFWF